MTYTTKYKIGDRIKYRIKKREEVESPCYFCGGSGEALDYQGHLEECPACEGSGYLWDEVPVEKELEKVITEINITEDLFGKVKIQYRVSHYEYVKEEDVIS